MTCFSCCCCCRSSTEGGVSQVTEQELQEIARMRRRDQTTSPRELMPTSSNKHGVSMVATSALSNQSSLSKSPRKGKANLKVQLPQNKKGSGSLPAPSLETIDEMTEEISHLTFDDHGIPLLDPDILKHIAEYLASDDPMENFAFMLFRKYGEEAIFNSRDSHFEAFVIKIREYTFSLYIDPSDEKMVQIAKTYFPNLQSLSLKLIDYKSNNFENLPSFEKVRELTLRAAKYLTISGLENLMEFPASKVRRFPQLEKLIIPEANQLLTTDAPMESIEESPKQKRFFKPEMQICAKRLFRKMRLLQAVQTGSQVIMREVSMSSMHSISRSAKEPVVLGPRRMLMHTASDMNGEADKDSPSFNGAEGRGRSQSTHGKTIFNKNALSYLMDGNLSEEPSVNTTGVNDPLSSTGAFESAQVGSSSMFAAYLAHATQEPTIKEEDEI